MCYYSGVEKALSNCYDKSNFVGCTASSNASSKLLTLRKLQRLQLALFYRFQIYTVGSFVGF
jgi:hypothetical protein